MRKRNRERLSNAIIIICRIVGIITFIFSLVMGVIDIQGNTGNYFVIAFESFLFVVLSFLPNILSGRFNIVLPAWLQSSIVVFIFAAMILGEIRGFYAKYSWWDLMLHTWSGFLIGCIGFLIIYSLNHDTKTRINMSLLGVAAFAFCFAMACGGIWEMFEYFADVFFGANMQKGFYPKNAGELHQYTNRFGRFMDPALVDTMNDILVDTIGALIASLLGYTLIKMRKASILFPKNMVECGVKEKRKNRLKKDKTKRLSKNRK